MLRAPSAPMTRSASSVPPSVTTVARDCSPPGVALITSVPRRTVTPDRREACSSSQLSSRCQAVVSRSTPCCTGGSSAMPVTSRSRSTSTPSPPPPSTARAGLRSSTVTAKPRRDSVIAVESPTRLPPATMHRIGVSAERSVITEPFHRTPPAKRQPVPGSRAVRRGPGWNSSGLATAQSNTVSKRRCRQGPEHPIPPLGQGRQLPAHGAGCRKAQLGQDRHGALPCLTGLSGFPAASALSPRETSVTASSARLPSRRQSATARR